MNNPKMRTVVVLAAGALLGYLVAASGLRITWQAEASPGKQVDARPPAGGQQAPCCAGGDEKGILVAQADKLPQGKKPAAVDAAHEADRDALLQLTRDFTAAFEKGDPKALAAFWTEQGEYESDDGTTLHGRSAIEAAFAAHFKGRAPVKMEIQLHHLRFPARDVAVEEGLTRTTASDVLPASAFYRVLYVREDGKWRIGYSREWGAAENRLADLEWLIGTWRGQAKDQALVISFARDKDQPFINGEFSTTVAGKSIPLGTMKIGMDPVSGQFMSWHFDPDGGHGLGTWLREGKHWVVDSRGNQANGTETAAVNVLTRFGDDEVGWRSIDRVVGGHAQPDSLPVKLKRVAVTK